MLIKVLSYFLDHQEDSFSLLLRPSYSPLFLYNAFRRFPLIPFVYFTHPKKKTDTKKPHYKVAKQPQKQKKAQKYKLFNKKVEFNLAGSIRIDKSAADFHIPPP